MSEVVGYGSLNFSTDEQIVGKWIDGKPIYQKVVEIGSFPAEAWTPVVTLPTNCVIIAFFGLGELSNGEQYNIGGPYIRADINNGGQNNKRYELYVNPIIGGFTSGYVILLYTKTTD